jgi:D-3-phosphoglycerate dehydrogenase
VTVLNAEPYGYSEAAVATWSTAGYAYAPVPWDELEDKAYSGVEGLIVRLARRVDGTVLDRFPDLCFVVSATTGWDHLDVDELTRRGIRLYSLREHTDFLQTIPSTAEHTWALVLALARNVPRADADVRAGRWRRDVHRGIELAGRTLGIVGLGRTGRRVACYARSFGMNVQYVDPHVDGVPNARKVNSIGELAAGADVMSIHVHLADDTVGLVGAEEVQALRAEALLINTSRGGIWDERAVAEAVRTERLGGVATDVLATEMDDVEASPLWAAQRDGANVVITPHLGGATWDAMHACEGFIARQVCRAESHQCG